MKNRQMQPGKSRFGTVLAVTAALLSVAATDGQAATQLPAQIGTCVATTIASIGSRLVDGQTGRPIPGSGSAVNFDNSGYQVSYDEVPEISRSRSGDPVIMCLIQKPKGCPAGDDRGKIYTTTNLRTLQSWTLPDAEHSCGGA